MISPASAISRTAEPTRQVLVRYGTIPQVARFSPPAAGTDRVQRGSRVIVRTDRGLEVGEVLETVAPASSADSHAPVDAERIERVATPEDLSRQERCRKQAADLFPVWLQRIGEWDLDLQLVDVEVPLDEEHVILYVLNDRGAETTRLALLAAAAGHGIVTVQPVAAEGIVAGHPGGCGSGCGSSGCGGSGGTCHS